MSALEKEFPARVRAKNVNALTPESSAIVRELGFDKHGVAIRDAAGRVLYRKGDHEVREAELRRELIRLARG